jgi:hypothetical protein
MEIEINPIQRTGNLQNEVMNLAIFRQGVARLFRIKNSFPSDLYAVIKFYILHRTFRVTYGKVTLLTEINSGIPQGRTDGENFCRDTI